MHGWGAFFMEENALCLCHSSPHLKHSPEVGLCEVGFVFLLPDQNSSGADSELTWQGLKPLLPYKPAVWTPSHIGIPFPLSHLKLYFCLLAHRNPGVPWPYSETLPLRVTP